MGVRLAQTVTTSPATLKPMSPEELSSPENVRSVETSVPVPVCVVALSNADGTSVELNTGGAEDDVAVPTKAVVQGRLQNSEMLSKLDSSD